MEKPRDYVGWMVAVLLIGLCCAGASPAEQIIYVDSSATGANNGTSWADAFIYLQDAIAAAAPHDEIRAAAGVYKPDQGAGYTPGDRGASFVLKNLVRIVGGYPAGGAEIRDVETYKTVLSGDLLGDDDPNALVEEMLDDPNRAENSYHVIYSDLCGPPTLLDGLIITGGQADGQDALAKGGGWFNITNGSPTLENCTFIRNCAQQRGGAWYNEGANCRPVLKDVRFTENCSADRGGAVAMLNTGANAALDRCGFVNNNAGQYGGAIYLDKSSPTLRGCSLSDNSSTHGGAMAGVDRDSVKCCG